MFHAKRLDQRHHRSHHYRSDHRTSSETTKYEKSERLLIEIKKAMHRQNYRLELNKSKKIFSSNFRVLIPLKIDSQYLFQYFEFLMET